MNPIHHLKAFNMKQLRIFFGLAMIGLPGFVLANVIIVNTTADENNNDGDCSLREAVRSANEDTNIDNCNAGLGSDAIFIFETGTINIGTGILITDEVSVSGPGIDDLTLDSPLFNHFVVNMPDDTHDFELSGMTLANGSNLAAGGSILIQNGGDFLFEDLRFSNNRSTSTNDAIGGVGGAIGVALPPGAESTMTIRRCLFENNFARLRGGALAVRGIPGFAPLESLIIEESRFSENSSDDDAGAIYANDVNEILIDRSEFTGNESDAGTGGAVLLDASATSDLYSIRASTFVDNSAFNGGALGLINGFGLIDNSTFTGNISVSGLGNSIISRFNSVVGIAHSTFVANSSSRPVDDTIIAVTDGASVSMGHSIVWSEDAASEPECSVVNGDGTFTSQGYNIDASGSCTSLASDSPMTDPQLAPLGDYGDDTDFLTLQTFLPLNGPAKNGGQSGPCPGNLGATLSVDQRGQPRPTSAGANRCDIGAVEVQSGSDPTGYPFTVTINSGNGTVISSPGGIDCPGDCIGQFLQDSVVTLTAVPAPGFAFGGWSDACSGTNPTCQFTITAAGSATANFVESSDEIFSDRFEN